MPYIKRELRPYVDREIDSLIENIQKFFDYKQVDGVLNYAITRLIKGLYPPKYFNYNRAVGVLECCKLELYRAVIGPYEETKRKQNGDVK